MEIWVPDSAREKVGECYLCGMEFAAGDNVVRHMKACVVDGATGHAVRQAREEKVERLAIFLDREAWDSEIEDHMRKVGQRMLAEGRWEVKPNERAGFS